MKNINIEELVQYFGYSIESPELMSVLQKQNIEIKYSKRELLNDGSAFIECAVNGLDLSLSTRSRFLYHYKKNPLDSGKAVFDGVDLVINSNNESRKYQGQRGFGLDGIFDKQAMHAKHGKPFFELLKSDGNMMDQRWRITDTLILTVKYSDDDTISLLQFGIPFADFYK